VMEQQREFDLEKYRFLLKKFKNRKPNRIYDSMEKEAQTLFGQ